MRDPIASNTALSFETQLALRDAKNDIHENGTLILFKNRTESDVERDKYSSINYRTPTTDISPLIEIMCNQLTFTPNKRELKKAGLTEESELSLHTAMLDWMELGITFYQIDIIRPTFIIFENEYEIKEKSLIEQYLSNFLFITFGLNRI